MSMGNLRGWKAVLGAVVATGLLAGCSGLRNPLDRPALPGTPRYAREQAARNGGGRGASPVDPRPRSISELIQLDNGPGVVVCEPVAAGMPRPLRDFGAGCSRWLHFQVAGHPELGKTPTWDNLNDVMIALDRRKGWMTPEEAAHLSTRVGATHAAVGRISGSVQSCTLEYQLYEVPAKRPVGPSLKVSGSLTKVASQLPQMARQLCSGLGIPRPAVSERVVESPADLQLLGGLPRPQRSILSAQQTARLASLAATSPLAGTLYVFDGLASGSGEEITRRSEVLLQLVPDHPVAWGTIGLCHYNSGSSTAGKLSQRIEQLAQKQSGNYQIRSAYANLTALSQNWVQTRYLEEEAIRCATRNALAWHPLSQALGNQAQAIRRGRTVNRISAKEWELLRPLYAARQEAAQQAVTLDPTMGDLWVELAYAATFNSDARTADQALWKGIELGSTGTSALFWGFEIYQDKWFGDAAKLQKIAETTARTEFEHSYDRIAAAEVLYNFKSRDARGMLYPRVLRTAEERKQIANWIKGVQQHASHGHQHAYRVKNPRKRYDDLLPPAEVPSAPQLRVVHGHAGGVSAVTWSPDGSRLAAAGWDGRISIASASGELVGMLAGHNRHVRTVAWSPDGSRLASGGSDGTVRLWDVEASALLKTMRGHQGRVLALAWQSSERLLSGGEDRTLRVWDIRAGKQVRVLPNLAGEVRALALRPDGTRLAVSLGIPASEVSLWDAATLKPMHSLPLAPNLLHSLAWSPRGDRLATASNHGIHLWNAESGEMSASIHLPRYLALSLAWSADGSQILYMGGDRKFHQVDAATGEERLEGEENTKRALSIAWDSRSGRLASGGMDGNVILWDTARLMHAPRGVEKKLIR